MENKINTFNKLIFQSIQNNIIYIILLILQTCIFSKIIISCPEKFKILTQFFLNHFSEIIQSLIITPISNNIIGIIKNNLMQIEKLKSEEVIYTKITKSHNIRIVLQGIFSIFRSILLIIFLIKNNKPIIIFCFFYAILIYYAQKIIIKKRREAWNATSSYYNDINQSLNEFELIKQNLWKTKINNIQKEKNKWIVWNTTINIIKLFFLIMLMLGNLSLSITIPVIFQLWLLTKHLFTTCGYIDDFQRMLNIKKTHHNNHFYNDNFITIENVQIFNIGPINMKEGADCIILKAPNGSGKSLIAKAIANLIPYQGQITSPKTFYLSLDSQNIQDLKISKGESILNILEIAIKKDYKLFILDEVLDILSQQNQEKILNTLEQKRLFIITHNNINISRNYQNYTIKNNALFRI